MQKDINDMTKGVEFYPIRHSGLAPESIEQPVDGKSRVDFTMDASSGVGMTKY